MAGIMTIEPGGRRLEDEATNNDDVLDRSEWVQVRMPAHSDGKGPK